MNPFQISAAYKFVAVFLMLCEVNHTSQLLHLNAPNPVEFGDLKYIHVSPHYLRGKGSGALDTKNYSFGFSKKGVLWIIVRINFFEKGPLMQLHLKQVKLQSLVNKEQALELARSWLKAIDVSVPDLEKENSPTVEQEFFYADGTSDSPRVLLPIFDVTWAHDGKPAAFVSIYGPTKELLKMRLEEESFSKRPAITINDIDGLLNLTNDEFLKYSDEQLEALLKSHANTSDERSKLLSSLRSKDTNELTHAARIIARTRDFLPARPKKQKAPSQ